jgi:hypothetical protein
VSSGLISVNGWHMGFEAPLPPPEFALLAVVIPVEKESSKIQPRYFEKLTLPLMLGICSKKTSPGAACAARPISKVPTKSRNLCSGFSLKYDKSTALKLLA